MKNLTKYLPLLITMCVFNACRNVQPPTSPSAGTATIRGQALLDSSYSMQINPLSGIHVSLEGTSYSTVTDDSGSYEFDGVPEGTYQVLFSKPGFGDVRWFGVAVQGGGNAPIYWYDQQPWHNVIYPTLYKQPSFVTNLRSIEVVDTTIQGYGTMPTILIHGIYTGLQPYYTHQIAVYYSHHSNVSSKPGEYEWYECWGTSWSPWDTVNRTFVIPVNFGDLMNNHGFSSGDSVYIATYGAPIYGTSPYYDYYDPSYRIDVLTSLNQTLSPVLGSKLP